MIPSYTSWALPSKRTDTRVTAYRKPRIRP